MVAAGKECAKVHSQAAEDRWDVKAEKHFQSQRELPAGRDFRWNTPIDSKEAKISQKLYRENFDDTFPDAPGVGI
jgi:hypothetical protein